MVANLDGGPPAWFWTAIEQAHGQLQDLAGWLEKISKELLVEYAAWARLARLGLRVEHRAGDVEAPVELAQWVVLQGRAAWERAMTSDDELRRLVAAFRAGEGGWNVELDAGLGQHTLESIAFVTFHRRFGGDLHEALDDWFEPGP